MFFSCAEQKFKNSCDSAGIFDEMGLYLQICIFLGLDGLEGTVGTLIFVS